MSISEKLETNIDVYFVQSDSLHSQASDIMKSAFDFMVSFEFDPVWIQSEECLKVSEKDSKIFVMDPFEGKAFEHLKSLHCRVIGPLCISYCLRHGDALPKRPYPIYSVSMRKLTVCCSNIDPEKRNDIRRKVLLMGGFFSRDFTENVTHLIVDEVGSEKYQEATKCGLPIMVSEWVTDVWSTSQYQHLHAANKYFKKFRCPIFKGLTITVSQLSSDERSLIKSIVEEHGGTYSSSLKHGKTTYLVLSQPMGDKYCFAKKWGVACVNIQWICGSVESGSCKDVSSYLLKDEDCDKASAENDSNLINLDESVPNNVSSQQPKIVNLCDLDTFDLSALPKNGQYLDGCKIYLTGFSPTHMDKLRKIVNSGGGMRFSKYSDSISHVVCGNISGDFLTCLQQSSVKPYVVNFNWLLECCKNESLVDEKMFLCIDATPLSPEKNETEDLKENKLTLFRSYSQPVGNVRDVSDIFEQYIQNQSNENICVAKENQNGPGKKLICKETEVVPERKCLSDFNSAITKASRQKRLSRHKSVSLDLPSQIKGCSRKRKSLTSQNNLSKTKLTRGSAEF